MIIKKYGHSCMMVENAGKKLLFDPGLFVFIDGIIKTKDIGPVDVVVITHSHPDHLYLEALRELHQLSSYTLVASEDIVQQVKQGGLDCKVSTSTHNLPTEIAGFTLLPQVHSHERIPIPAPPNTGYLVNGRFYHTGDSYLISDVMKGLEAVTVPNGGPWSTTLQSVEFLKQVKPKIALPIHDGMHKDFWLERLNDSMNEWSSELGVEYRVLLAKHSIEI